MRRKTKSEILLKLVQMMKSRAFGVKKPNQDYLDGFMDALEWTISIHHHSEHLNSEKTVSIKSINKRIAKEMNEQHNTSS